MKCLRGATSDHEITVDLHGKNVCVVANTCVTVWMKKSRGITGRETVLGVLPCRDSGTKDGLPAAFTKAVSSYNQTSHLWAWPCNDRDCAQVTNEVPLAAVAIPPRLVTGMLSETTNFRHVQCDVQARTIIANNTAVTSPATLLGP
jgi:hypothetical protein